LKKIDQTTLLIINPAVEKHVRCTVDAVEELALSQENAPGAHRTSEHIKQQL